MQWWSIRFDQRPEEIQQSSVNKTIRALQLLIITIEFAQVLDEYNTLGSSLQYP